MPSVHRISACTPLQLQPAISVQNSGDHPSSRRTRLLVGAPQLRGLVFRTGDGQPRDIAVLLKIGQPYSESVRLHIPRYHEGANARRCAQCIYHHHRRKQNALPSFIITSPQPIRHLAVHPRPFASANHNDPWRDQHAVSAASLIKRKSVRQGVNIYLTCPSPLPLLLRTPNNSLPTLTTICTTRATSSHNNCTRYRR